MAVISRNRRGRIFKHFLESEKAGGIFLILCTVISLVLSNSPVSESYTHFWHLPLHLSFSAIAIDFSLEDWINDGLMTIFFLMVGLEIERELYVGELSVRKNALLPIIGAIGGMAFPALIHFFFNRNTPTQAAIGIPIATDIAFTLGLLSLIGSRVPSSLKIFLTALAIIDDLGAIIIIAVFYSKGFSLFHFSIAIAIFGLLQVFNRMKIKRIAIYLTGGVFMWYFMLKSGVHSTITGVLLAFCIPFDKDDESNPSQQLQLDLHNIVNYVIIPVFALANTGIRLHPEWWRSLAQNNSLGIIAGLVAGKPLGIFFVYSPWCLVKNHKTTWRNKLENDLWFGYACRHWIHHVYFYCQPGFGRQSRGNQ